jgi:hypothetical protein
MRYQIEFLRRPCDEDSVCLTREPGARDLRIAEFQAQAWSAHAHAALGARAWQIRDLDKNGRIVSVELFDGAMQRVN